MLLSLNSRYNKGTLAISKKVGIPLKKVIFLLMSIQFLIYLGFGIIIPVLPEVIVQHSWDEIHVGGLITSYAIASFFTAPIWGKISDSVGRKPLIIFGLIGFSLSFLISSLFLNNLFLLYISRIVGGLFSGALYTSITGYVGDISSNNERNKYMGFIGMSIGLGFIFGPAIGGMLGHINLQLPFTASAILVAFICIFTLFTLKEPQKHVENTKQIIPPGASKLFRYRIKYLFLFSFFVTFTLAGVEATFQLFQINKINITPFTLGILFMFSGFVDAAIQGVIIRKIKDGSETNWLIGAQIVTAIGLLFITLSTNVVFAGFALCVFTAGNALARTCIVSLTSKESGGQYGTSAGITYSMDNLGRIIGPVFFAYLFKINMNFTYYTSILIALIAIFLIIFFNRSNLSLRFNKLN